MAPSEVRSPVANSALQALHSLTGEGWEFLLAQASPTLLAPFGTDPVVGPRIAPPASARSSREGRMVIRCLGGLEVIRAGHPLRHDVWQRAAPRRLLQYLLLQDRPMHREEVMESLWPGSLQRHGANQLRVALTHLRRVLEPARQAREPSSLLLTSGQTIAIARDRFDLDLDRFRRALARASALEGPARRAALALSLLAELEELEGRHQAALSHWLEAIEADSAAEQAYRGLIRCYLALGRAADALRAFESGQTALADLGASLSPETVALRRSIPSPKQETPR